MLNEDDFSTKVFETCDFDKFIEEDRAGPVPRGEYLICFHETIKVSLKGTNGSHTSCQTFSGNRILPLSQNPPGSGPWHYPILRLRSALLDQEKTHPDILDHARFTCHYYPQVYLPRDFWTLNIGVRQRNTTISGDWCYKVFIDAIWMKKLSGSVDTFSFQYG